MKTLKLQALYAALSRLSKREKLILYAAISFISLTVLDRLIISPVFSKLKSLDREIKERESAIKKGLRILAQKDRILAESAKYSSISSGESSEDEMTSVLREIESLASKNSVYLIDMKPAGLKSEGAYSKYQISLSCEAQMEQIVSFMYDIENSGRILTIDKYEISPKAKESSVAQCNMSVSKIIMQ